MAFNPLGWLYGQLDKAYFLQRVVAGAQRPLLFSSGWKEEGSSINMMKEYEALADRLANNKPVVDSSLDIVWDEHAAQPPRVESAGGCTCRRNKRSSARDDGASNSHQFAIRTGRATSPLATILPAGPPQTLRFLYISDADAALPWEENVSGESSRKPSTVTVILPATGEQGYGDRIKVSKQLLARLKAEGRGLGACVLIMAPLYASRKPADGQRKHYVTTVAGYQAQSMAVMTEAAALLAWAHGFAPGAQLVSTGFSWGAAMAACAGLLATSLLPTGVAEKQLAIVPYVGSCSPEPVVVGVLGDDIDWPALVKGRVSHEPAGETVDVSSSSNSAAKIAEARARLRAELKSTHTRWFVEALAASAKVQEARLGRRHSGAYIGAAVCVAMLHDHFLHPQYAEELHHLLSTVAPPGRTRYITLGGGHVAAYLQRESKQVDAICQALGLMAA